MKKKSVVRIVVTISACIGVVLIYQNCSKVNFQAPAAGLAQGIDNVPNTTSNINPGTDNPPGGGTDTGANPSPSPSHSPSSNPSPSPSPTKGVCVLVPYCPGGCNNHDGSGENNYHTTTSYASPSPSPSPSLAVCDPDVNNAEKDPYHYPCDHSGPDLLAARVLKYFDGSSPNAKDACMSKSACDYVNETIQSGHSNLFQRTDSDDHQSKSLSSAYWIPDTDGRCENDKDHDCDVDDGTIHHGCDDGGH